MMRLRVYMDPRRTRVERPRESAEDPSPNGWDRTRLADASDARWSIGRRPREGCLKPAEHAFGNDVVVAGTPPGRRRRSGQLMTRQRSHITGDGGGQRRDGAQRSSALFMILIVLIRSRSTSSLGHPRSGRRREHRRVRGIAGPLTSPTIRCRITRRCCSRLYPATSDTDDASAALPTSPEVCVRLDTATGHSADKSLQDRH